MTADGSSHVPVMLAEVVDYLAPRTGGVYVDCTLGGGGHAAAILSASAPTGRVIGLDRDAEAVARAGRRLAAYRERLSLTHAAFDHLHRVLAELDVRAVDGVLFDLGISSDQLGDPARGLSFRVAGPLDMRLDTASGTTAADLVNELPEDALADILYRLGEEPRSRRIARAIVRARPLATTLALADVVARGAGYRGGRTHPATRTFQALRMAVNDELGSLARALPQATDALTPGGRLVAITFHSLEDRLVKRHLTDEARSCVCPPGLLECVCDHQPRLKVLTRRPVSPSDAELAANPRARSAKLRAAERISPADIPAAA